MNEPHRCNDLSGGLGLAFIDYFGHLEAAKQSENTTLSPLIVYNNGCSLITYWFVDFCFEA